MARRWMPLWVVPVLILVSIGTVWLRLHVIRVTYAINQTDKEIRAIQQARDDAEVKLTALRSPRRLEALARQKFGLSQPKAEQVVHLQEKQRGSHDP